MHNALSRTTKLVGRKVIASFTLAAFFVTSGIPVSFVHSQELFQLPQPGTRISLSPSLSPPLLKGLKLYPDNPFQLDFILDKGDSIESDAELKEESVRLIKYFLASLTVPEKDLWVNLSPYEKDRIIPDAFGVTEMGRDLLAQDYLLKQITASVIYPEESIGKQFWSKVYAEAQERFGTTDIPVDTFNKVWIIPETAVVYENTDSAYVIESRLKVMLEEDYLALEKNAPDREVTIGGKESNKLGSDIVREVVIPILEKEVNEGQNFARLRQVYNSLILAVWFKDQIKESIFGQAYVDRDKVAGVDIEDKAAKDKIWAQYVEAFKKGAYNYIKEEYDPVMQETLPRKYFSGGVDAARFRTVLSRTRDAARLPGLRSDHAMVVRSNLTPSALDKDAAQKDSVSLLSRRPPEIIKRIYKDAAGKDRLAMASIPEGAVRFFLEAIMESGLKENIILQGGGVRDLVAGASPLNINYFVRGEFDPQVLRKLEAEVQAAAKIRLVNMGRREEFNLAGPEFSINRVSLSFDKLSEDPLIQDLDGGLDDLLTNQAVLVGEKPNPISWSILLPRFMEKMIRFKLKPGPLGRKQFQEFLDWVEGPYAQVLATETLTNTDRQVLAVCEVYRKWIGVSFSAENYDQQVAGLWDAIQKWADIEEAVEPGKDLLGVLGLSSLGELKEHLEDSVDPMQSEEPGDTSRGPAYENLRKSWLEIHGGTPLKGEVVIGGSKHSVTNLMGALLLADGHLEIDNFPTSRDGMEMLEIYRSFGVNARFEGKKLVLDVEPSKLQFTTSEIQRTRLLRASILLLGSALLRFGRIEFPWPGGDKIGRDFHKHLEILDDFGIKHGPAGGESVTASLERPLEGDFTVDAYIRSGSGEGYSGTYTTALAMTLAAGNKGRTVINQAIVASEITELGRFLQSLGVKVEGLGTDRLVIESPGIWNMGKVDLKHKIDPDKVEFAFWVVAAIMTKGQIDIQMDYDGKMDLDDLGPLGRFYREILEPMGVSIAQTGDRTFRVDAQLSHLTAVDLKTVYRGRYANWADVLMQLLPLLAVTPGKSSFVDTKHGNIRLRGLPSLNRMGAKISVADGGVEINGTGALSPAPELFGSDIRDAANLLLAALSASGTSTLFGKEYIERSYDGILAKITRLGGDVRSIDRPAPISENTTDDDMEKAVRTFLRSQKFGYSLDNDTGGVFVRTIVQTFGDELRSKAGEGRTIDDIVRDDQGLADALYMGELSRMFRYGQIFEETRGKLLPPVVDGLIEKYRSTNQPQSLEIGIVGVSYGQELVSLPILLGREVGKKLQAAGLPATAIALRIKVFNKETSIYSKVKANQVYYPADLMDVYRGEISQEELDRYFKLTPKGFARSDTFEEQIEFYDVDLTDKGTFPRLGPTSALVFVHNVLHHVSTYLFERFSPDEARQKISEAEVFLNSLIMKGGGMSIVAQGDLFYGGLGRAAPNGFSLLNTSGASREMLLVRTADPAMKGGIDLTPDKMDLQVRGPGAGVRFKFDPGMVRQLRDLQGLTPVIIDMRPLTTTLPIFLGLKEDLPAERLSMR